MSALLGVTRPLGKTGHLVEPVSLGGEGILRTHGRSREAVPMILEALRLGVKYCDTAPAYDASQTYYGEAFRSAGLEVRKTLFLATKTHERTRDRALRLLDDSLAKLSTEYVDLWQMHDLRTIDELDRIFAKGGAIEAAESAKRDGRVRHIGLTGHHDPEILLEAMKRYPFDAVLCAINPADPVRAPFISTVVADARRRGMAVIGMKVMAAGRILADRTATAEELIRYGASIADTVIIGCSSPTEISSNMSVGRQFTLMSIGERTALEARLRPQAARYDSFKA